MNWWSVVTLQFGLHIYRAPAEIAFAMLSTNSFGSIMDNTVIRSMRET